MRSNADHVIYRGMKNGRPDFEFGPDAPPKWLIKLLGSHKTRWDDGSFIVNGKALEPGAMVRKEDGE